MNEAQEHPQAQATRAIDAAPFTDLTDSMRRVLAALESGSTIIEAAKAGGITRATVWNWRQRHKDFAAAFAIADELGIQAMEDALIVCAEKAIDDPRFQPSLHFALKARRPEKYRERIDMSHRIGGDANRPIRFTFHMATTAAMDKAAQAKQAALPDVTMIDAQEQGTR